MGSKPVITPANIYDDLRTRDLIPQLMPDRDFQLLATTNRDFTSDKLRSLAMHSDSQHRYESAFNLYGRETDPDDFFWRINETVELARLPIPPGQIGILRRIDTLVIDAATGKPSEWNNPETYFEKFSFGLAYRDLNFGNSAQNRIAVIPNFFPMDPFPWYMPARSIPLWPFCRWTDDRFSWGNPSNEIRVPLPSGVLVSLFVISNGDLEFQYKVKGRLVLTLQTEKSLSGLIAAQRF